MKRVAILIDLELSNKSGGHVKFWEKICESLLKDKLEINMNNEKDVMKRLKINKDEKQFKNK